MSNEHVESLKDDETAALDTQHSAEAAAISQQSAVESEPTQTEKVPTKKSTGRKPSPSGAVVSGGSTDPVKLSACVVKNQFARKSLSVHHVQRRLSELGYREAGTDKDGWYGDSTVLAVRQYQADNSIDGDGTMNAATLESIFADDINVTVVAD
jgi:peptidoglycan hydrolase-like protein with peptidoglycan-binding domain